MLKRSCCLFLAFVILFCSAIGGTGVALANNGEGEYTELTFSDFEGVTEGEYYAAGETFALKDKTVTTLQGCAINGKVTFAEQGAYLTLGTRNFKTGLAWIGVRQNILISRDDSNGSKNTIANPGAANTTYNLRVTFDAVSGGTQVTCYLDGVQAVQYTSTCVESYLRPVISVDSKVKLESVFVAGTQQEDLDDICCDLNVCEGYIVENETGVFIDELMYTKGSVYSTLGVHRVQYTQGRYSYTGDLLVYYTGDINADGNIDENDLTILNDIIADADSWALNKAQLKAADFNCDDVIDEDDSMLLQAYIDGDTSNTFITYPVNGEEVPLANDVVAEFIKDYQFRDSLTYFPTAGADQYHMKPVVFRWLCSATGATFKIVLSRYADMSEAVTYETDETFLEVINLMTHADYYWKIITTTAAGDIETDVMHFRTEDTIRTITIDGVSNSRDLGGLQSSSGQIVKQGLVYRSGQLEGITVKGKEQVKALGIKTDLDLRNEGLSQSPMGANINLIECQGVYYVEAGTGISDPTCFDRVKSEIVPFADESNYPILFHCTAGRDRTGTLSFLLYALLGVNINDIYRDFELSVLSQAGCSPSEEHLRNICNQIVNTYSYIYNNYEGKSLAQKTENYLLTIGVTQNQIDSIRTIMLGGTWQDNDDADDTNYNDIVLDALRPTTEGGAGGPQDDEKRYLIIFDETTDVGATWVPGYVDGADKSVANAACIMMLGGKVTMLLQYDKVQSGATKFSQITPHTITFKAGTLLGNNYRLAEDLTIYVSGQTFSLTQSSQGSGSGGSQSGGQYRDITLDTLRPATEGGAGGSQDGEKRYLIIFNETTDIGAAWITGYVDGATQGTENVACLLMTGGKVAMLLQYDKVQAGATVASEIKEHTVTFKAGTLLGNNYKLAKDLTIYVNGHNFSLSKASLGAGGGQGGAGVTFENIDIKKPRPDAGDDHKYEFKVTYDSLAISNEVYSTSEEIHLEYTVKEVYNASAGKIGQIGAGTTKTPENRFPYDTAGGFMYYQNVQLTPKDEGHFLIPGATYHIVFKRQSEDIEIIATYTINGQQRIINIPNMAGQYDSKAGYIFIYSVGNVEAYLTNVKCYDAEGQSLGIQVNEPDIELTHYGGIFDYSDCIGTYYCRENNTLFKLNADHTFSKQQGAGVATGGKYTIYETYSMITEEDGKEVTYEYYYNHFIDSEGNRYVHMTEYKVEFVLDDETIESYMLTNETGYFIEEPDTPKKSGYTFEGWYLGNGTKYDFTQIVSESLTLYGRWKEGKAVEYKSVSADSGIGKILIPMLAVTVCSVLVATTVVVSFKIWKRGKRESEQ